MSGAGDQQERLNADWIVGFTDGEGCFHVGINKCPKMYVGYQVLPEFRIVQHEVNESTLEKIKEFFGFGKVTVNRADYHGVRKEFRVRGLTNLRKLVKFFDEHPLQTPARKRNFKLFREILRIMEQKKHLTVSGLRKIRKLALAMNRRRRLKWGVQNPQRPYAGRGTLLPRRYGPTPMATWGGRRQRRPPSKSDGHKSNRRERNTLPLNWRLA